GFAVALPSPTLSLAYLGKVRDKVGGGNTAFAPNGVLDGSFGVTVEAGSGARTVTRLELRANGGGWGHDGGTAHWGLGEAGVWTPTGRRRTGHWGRRRVWTGRC